MINSISTLPLTAEAFSQCWLRIDNCRKNARRQAVISQIGCFCVTLFFLLWLIFLANGLIYESFRGTYRDFLRSLSFFLPLWEPIWGLISGLSSLPGKITVLLGLDYVASILFFGVIFLAVRLFYHPLSRKCPQGSWEENTALLAKAAQEARDFSYRTRLVPSIVATVLAVIAAFILLFAYAVYVQQADMIFNTLSLFPTGNTYTNCVLYVLMAYLVSNVLCTPLLFLSRPIYRYEFPMELLCQIQKAALFASEPNASAETGAKLKEEALELEKINAYRRAMELLQQAALMGDVPAMEHFARHCLLTRRNDTARFWLKQAIASGDASPDAKKMLRRLKLHLRHQEEYRHADQAPLTGGQKAWNTTKALTSVIWKCFWVAALILSGLLCWQLYKASTNPEAYAQLQSRLDSLTTGETAPEESSEAAAAASTPLSLTEEGTPWEGGCWSYDRDGQPVTKVYFQAAGGDLQVSLLPETIAGIRSAGIYAGNIWDVRTIYSHVSFAAETGTLTVMESYLQTLATGEYFLILNDSCYIPLIVAE